MTNLSALLNILKDPASPAYAQALRQLEMFDPKTLTRDEFPSVLAEIETAIAAIQRQKAEAEASLAQLRNRAHALRSYTQYTRQGGSNG